MTKGGNDMNVGQNIKSRRKEIGMSAETIAEKLGLSPSTIYRYEKGDIEKVDSAKLIQIAEILRTTPAELMGWEDDQNDKIPPQETKPRKYRMLSAGALTLTDEQLDKVYAMAHLMYPDTFPLEEKERKEGQ